MDEKEEQPAQPRLIPHQGELFKRLRYDKGLTLAALADIADVDRSTIGRWESKAQLHNFECFCRALYELNVSPASFFNIELEAPEVPPI